MISFVHSLVAFPFASSGLVRHLMIWRRMRPAMPPSLGHGEVWLRGAAREPQLGGVDLWLATVGHHEGRLRQNDFNIDRRTIFPFSSPKSLALSDPTGVDTAPLGNSVAHKPPNLRFGGCLYRVGKHDKAQYKGDETRLLTVDGAAPS